MQGCRRDEIEKSFPTAQFMHEDLQLFSVDDRLNDDDELHSLPSVAQIDPSPFLISQ